MPHEFPKGIMLGKWGDDYGSCWASTKTFLSSALTHDSYLPIDYGYRNAIVSMCLPNLGRVTKPNNAGQNWRLPDCVMRWNVSDYINIIMDDRNPCQIRLDSKSNLAEAVCQIAKVAGKWKECHHLLTYLIESADSLLSTPPFIFDLLKTRTNPRMTPHRGKVKRNSCSCFPENCFH